MKKIIILFIAVLLLYATAYTQENYPFDVKVSGLGTKSIIFIPGFACSGEVWNEALHNFEADYKCYTLTMAGFAGVSAEANPNFKNWIESVAKYIKQQKMDKPLIVGHSLGGVMALSLAADFPELVSKIVVVDALPCLSVLYDSTFTVKDNPDCTIYENRYKSMDDKQFYQMEKKMIPALIADTSMVETIIGWGMKSDRTTMAQIFCQFLNTDVRNSLSNIICPSLILLEPGFKTINPVIEGQYKNLNGAQLQYASKGLHFIMYDDTEWYIEQLKAFLK